MTAPRTRDAVVSVFALGLAVAVGRLLSAYGVPVLLLLSCSLSVASSAVWLLSRLTDGARTRSRCAAPGCDFQVRTRGVDAAEARRWQETAADHPLHRYRNPRS
ncbi:hypothetical protein [Streptomyces sp. CA-253872]|uniref:hypothetical protein n=1 Tax=Streptomyces sp. CA-253872 TaxID=3240067 RepID=UPI003D93595B